MIPPFHHGLRPVALRRAFTLVEMMVGVAILLMIMTVIASVMNHTSVAVKVATSKLEASQASRATLDTIGQRLAQATLNTYWDYDNPLAPTRFIRKSDLHFLNLTSGDYSNVGLTAPVGTTHGLYFETPEAMSANSNYDQCLGLLNACGFFVEFGSDNNTSPKWTRPAHVKSPVRYRYRLMQALQPAENLAVFSGSTGSAWAQSLAGQAWPLADNVIALIAQPRLSVGEDANGDDISPNYFYDSRGATPVQKAQLPPIMQLTMIVIDEASATRLENGSSQPAAIENALKNRFTTVSKYQEDLAAVEQALSAARIKYQVVTSSILLRESKWSREVSP